MANRLTYGLDDATVAVSATARDSAPPRLRRQVETVIHGLELATVWQRRSERSAARQQLGVGPDEVLVGVVANLRVQKNYPLMLEAAAEVVRRVPSVRFVSLGQGPLEADLVSRRDRLGLGDRFRFLGHVPDAPAVMSAFDVFALSSDQEGLPVALMEALALGLPVVVTAVGGMPHVVDPSVGSRGASGPGRAPGRCPGRAGPGPGAAGRAGSGRRRPGGAVRRVVRRASVGGAVRGGGATLMCGFAGLLDPTASTGTDALRSTASRMAAVLAARGPDGSGEWADAEVGVGLGHRRLSIQDLSEAGAQPMVSADGRWVLAYNGEVYNHRGLVRDLPRRGCRSGGTRTRRSCWRPSRPGGWPPRSSGPRACGRSRCGTATNAD